nr:MAG TPA: hypothetical protein [Caudoviricetes sp.]
MAAFRISVPSMAVTSFTVAILLCPSFTPWYNVIGVVPVKGGE